MHKLLRIFFPLWLIAVVCALHSCRDHEPEPIRISGEAQGTTYHIAWYSDSGKNWQEGVDSILRKIDSSLSTYLPASLISQINRNEPEVPVDEHFTKVFNKAREVAEKTGGAFDITVAPVVNAWGFGFSKRAQVDSAMIDSLVALVGYEKARLVQDRVVKELPGVMLDFNAIAQGYTVDVLGAYLEQQGIANYFVELGGEVKARGRKPDGTWWTIGIDRPVENSGPEHRFEAIMRVENRGVATSGNYRKFYEEGGKKMSHIIDPHTGYPAGNSLLSATVVAPDCMTADAYATAFMVMGLAKAKIFLEQNRDLGLEAYFIGDANGKWKTWLSPGLQQWVTEEDD